MMPLLPGQQTVPEPPTGFDTRNATPQCRARACIVRRHPASVSACLRGEHRYFTIVFTLNFFSEP